MLNTSRRIYVLVFVLIVLTVGYFARLGMSSVVIPTTLLEARQSGSAISQEIVDLSSEFNQKLEQINQLEKEGKYEEALDLSTEMMQRIPVMREKAAELSRQLEKMASALVEVNSPEARQAAVDSITNRMALISRLFSYSDYLSQLSNALQDRFRQVPNYQNVSELTQRINAEVQAVSIFNKEASEAMSRFDQLMASGK